MGEKQTHIFVLLVRILLDNEIKQVLGGPLYVDILLRTFKTSIALNHVIIDKHKCASYDCTNINW